MNIVTDFDLLWPVRCCDGGGSGIPACGLAAVTAVTVDNSGRILVTLSKPTGTPHKTYAAVSRWGVPAGGYGRCALSGAVPVAYDTGTPAVDDLWGPASGQWTASKTANTGTCLAVLGVIDATNKIMLATITPPGPPSRVKGTAGGLVTKSTATFTVTALTSTDGQSNPSGSSFTITNPGFCIDSSAIFYAEWDSSLSTPGYRVYDAPCSTNAGC